MGPVSFFVRLTPKGGRDAVEGWVAGGDGIWRLKIRVAAPPVDGAANAALTDLIAQALGLPRRDVRIAGGAHGRLKRVEVTGVAQDDLRRAFGPPPQGADVSGAP